jgi:hypothetical protein
MANNTLPANEEGSSRKMDLTSGICPVAHQMLARALEDVMAIHYGIKDPIAGEGRVGEELRPMLQIGYGGEATEEQEENFNRFTGDIIHTLNELAFRNAEEDQNENAGDVVYDPDMNVYHARSVESFIDFFQAMSVMKGLGWDNATPLSAGPVPMNGFTRIQAEKILQRKPQLLPAFQKECYATLDAVYQAVLQADKEPPRPRYSLDEIRRANALKPDSRARLWMN